jgi:hypothetical protein
VPRRRCHHLDGSSIVVPGWRVARRARTLGGPPLPPTDRDPAESLRRSGRVGSSAGAARAATRARNAAEPGRPLRIERNPDRSAVRTTEPDAANGRRGGGRTIPSSGWAAPGAEGSVPPEALLVVLRGIGASMFLTDRHLIVARDGAERRPRSGFQAWTLDTIRHMRIELGSAPSGRIAVWTTGAQEALSMFFDARSLDRAHELLDVARPLIARSRRGRPGSEPVRPPIGPARPGATEPPGKSEPSKET